MEVQGVWTGGGQAPFIFVFETRARGGGSSIISPLFFFQLDVPPLAARGEKE